MLFPMSLYSDRRIRLRLDRSRRCRFQPCRIRPWAAVGLLLVVAMGYAGSAAADDSAIAHRTLEDFHCPEGTDARQMESPDGRFSAHWCEIRRGSKVARHGPYLELYADGSTYRQGTYFRGVQAGHWVRFSPAGEIERVHKIYPGEASRFLPQPEDVCPPGTRRRRSTGFDDRRRMWSQCYRGDDDERILEGPYITWDEQSTSRGRRYLLRRIMTYADNERHGRHRAFEGSFGKERLVVEETFVEGRLEGESRSFYLNGTLREQRFYQDGQLSGDRVGYYSNGDVRWRIVYQNGKAVSSEGDLTVTGRPCPGAGVPTTTADGLEDRCARRQLHFEEITGPFVLREASGQIVESGLYKHGEKVELWQSRDQALPVEVSDQVLVAEATLMLGEQVYMLPAPPAIPPDPWADAKLQNEDPEALQAELERVQALAEERNQALENPAVEIWFRDTESKRYPHPRTEIDNGRVKIYGLKPGKYYMRVEFDANRSNPRQYPGDLTSSSHFTVELDRVNPFEAVLLHSLRLLSPWDNNEPIPGWNADCGEEQAIPSQAHFAWSPPDGEVDGGIEWHYRITRMQCEPFRKLEVVAEGRTFDTAVDLELEPSARGESYKFTLLARRGDKVIGEMMSFGKNGGHGWAISFRAR